jgi:hypothetical protein
MMSGSSAINLPSPPHLAPRSLRWDACFCDADLYVQPHAVHLGSMMPWLDRYWIPKRWLKRTILYCILIKFEALRQLGLPWTANCYPGQTSEESEGPLRTLPRKTFRTPPKRESSSVL